MRWLVLLWFGCGFERTEHPPVPRLIAPLSTSSVNRADPTLKFALPPRVTAPVVEICRNRACQGTVIPGALVTGSTSAHPAQALSAGVWFWRVKATSPMGDVVSAVWQFRVVGPTDAPEAVWGGELDLDGDGFAELAVGAPYTVAGSVADGRVFVFGGGPDGPDSNRVTVLESPQLGARMGMALASVDFNGDGYADLAVGAPDFPDGDRHPGAVLVFPGGPGGVEKTPQVIAFPDSDSLGWSLSTAGDVNGDGFGDLVVGAPTTTAGNGMIRGMAFVLYGPSLGNSLITPLDPEPGALLATGAAVAGGGDLDGDGLFDVVVGSPTAGPAGHAWMFPGGPALGSPVLLDPGTTTPTNFGYSLLITGDRDGDGLADLAVGAPTEGPGHVYLYSGVRGGTPRETARLDGPDGADGNFGVNLAAADSDGDGIPDLVIAANCVPGGVPCKGRVYQYSTQLSALPDLPGVSYYGTSLTFTDLDHDGKPDLVVGSAEIDGQLGRADWYPNGATAPGRFLNGSDPTGEFGYSVR